MLDLKENIIKSTQDAEIHEDPFDHLYIENFFEHSFYEEILANIPNINVYGKIAGTGRVSKNYNPSREARTELLNIIDNYVNSIPQLKLNQ